MHPEVHTATGKEGSRAKLMRGRCPSRLRLKTYPPHNGYIDNERGEVTGTRVTARKIAQALGMTLAYLFNELERSQ